MRLSQLDARAIDGDEQAAAAWGDPPVVLRCGLIPAPSPVGQLVALDGVDWTAVPDESSVVWTTLGRQATVQVRVPRRYDSQAPLLARLSPLIIDALPTS